MVSNQLIVFQYLSFTVFNILTVTNSKYGTIHRQNPRLKIFLYRFWFEGEYRFSLKALNPQKTKKWTWSLPGKNALRISRTHDKTIARSRALLRQLTLNDHPFDLWPDIDFSRIGIILMMNNHQIVKWIIFSGWGKLGQSWPSFGLWPKNKSTPLALFRVTSVHF